MIRLPQYSVFSLIATFELQVQLLMRVHHRNLATFIAYCFEGPHIGIIYEYMAGGNLAEYLSGTSNVHSFLKAFIIASSITLLTFHWREKNSQISNVWIVALWLQIKLKML